MNEMQDKSVWISDGPRVSKMNISQVLPDTADDEDHWTIIKLLRSIRQFNTGGPSRIMISEVLEPNDERSWSPQFEEAKQKEIAGLIEKVAFKIVLKNKVPEEANILDERFVLATKMWELTNNYVKCASLFKVTPTVKKIYQYTL